MVDPKPVVTEGPGQDDEPAENTTATNETSVSTVFLRDPGADPGPVETASPDAAAENTTAPLPTDTIDAAPSTGTGVVENESVSSDTLPENETAGESVFRAAVLCVWEQLDPALGWLDDDPVQAGSQFLPPCAYGAEKTVHICAVVAGGGATPDLIVADVVSPDGSPFSRVNLTRQDSGTDALEAASMAGWSPTPMARALMRLCVPWKRLAQRSMRANLTSSFPRRPATTMSRCRSCPKRGTR